MDLILPVKREYFEQIKSGAKTEEYRLCNNYWGNRLLNKQFENVIITLGYPKRDDATRRLIFPYVGFCKKTITHKHFGNAPVQVFAIKLKEQTK